MHHGHQRTGELDIYRIEPIVSPEFARTPSMPGDMWKVGAIHAIQASWSRSPDGSYLWLPKLKFVYLGRVWNDYLVCIFPGDLGSAMTNGRSCWLANGRPRFMLLFNMFFFGPTSNQFIIVFSPSFLSLLNLSTSSPLSWASRSSSSYNLVSSLALYRELQTSFCLCRLSHPLPHCISSSTN